ncbi:glycoside hydrolase family 5 protein [Leucogyrophana mollusca]|uniref:Glycoside hydrolase family 5 protein n=1 Tax=Leucogyrophana mollusca TaxID=85980 RepID=A0ACB8AYF9_9AGAM|nr:glycoside hydrolase family 5 protein [Leucogyrophana mollusca]
MPSVPRVSPATGNPTPPSYIHTTSSNFVDSSGRTLLLRGVNLSGSSKAPVGQPSYVWDGFWETAERGGESFVGRPLNLTDGSADVHLARLRGWGFNMIRFPVTWEALEHAGPGKYDYEFMDYTIEVLRKCKEYGFKVFMNPHQDTWSRFSGGSGAPYWTLPACGIEPRNFTATQAAILHCEYPTPQTRDCASLPAMIWSTNYGRLASQTLFALFFAGSTFAPKCIIDDVNIQEYLQAHFTEAFGRLADRIRDAGDLFEEVVIGWDSMNEPYEGFVDYQDLNSVPTKQGSTLKKGTFPTPAQSFRLGMGKAQTVDNWSFGSLGPRKDGTVTIDPKGVKMWLDPSIEVDGVHPIWGWKRSSKWELGTCVWAQHGVWDVETGYVLLPEYFRYLPSPSTKDEVHFLQDFWLPQFTRYAARIRQSHPEAILFVQPPVFAQPPPIDERVLRGRACYSTHYYDGLTLVTRHWNWFNADALGLLRGKYSNTLQAVKIGESAIRASLQSQLGILKSDAVVLGTGAYPTIIGEIGVPFDMDEKRAYGWTDGGRYKGDYGRQERALDASLNAADGVNGLSWTVWTYCADNSHEWGDGWNMEDLSLWSEDDLRGGNKEVIGGKGMGGPAESRVGLLYASQSVSGTMTPVIGTITPALGTITPATASRLSLSTLPVEEQDSSIGITKPIATNSLYASLTDGARAVRAFCRPWPVAVVGTVRDVRFDIGKAFFKLVVSVGPGDRPVAVYGNGVDEDEEDGGKGKNDLPTEIYLPLVHFAADRCVGRLGEQQVDGEDDDASRSTSGTITPSVGSTLTLPSSGGACELDVEVKVSEGRWEVEGQMLRWWYSVGEGEKEVWIEVRRGKGAIKTREERERRARDGCVEWLGLGQGGVCPEGCVVM